MHRHFASLTLLLITAIAGGAHAASNWQPGRHYFLIEPAAHSPPVAAGKVAVTEVFSYGCPACYQFYPIADKLKAGLPANAEMTYVHAAFIPSENWPTFQLAYYTAVSLGIAEKTHNAMFEAIWSTGELGIVEKKTQQPKKVMPSIEDAAKFYSGKAGIKAETFVTASKSFSVNMAIRRAEEYIKATSALSTPTIVVNGKYRLDVTSAGGIPQLLELVNWLVAQESKK